MMNNLAGTTLRAADNTHEDTAVRPHTNCTSRAPPSKDLIVGNFRHSTESPGIDMSISSGRREDNFIIHTKPVASVEELISSTSRSQEVSQPRQPHHNASTPKTSKAVPGSSSSNDADLCDGDVKPASTAVNHAPVLFGRRAVRTLSEDLVCAGDLNAMQRRRSRRPVGNLTGGAAAAAAAAAAAVRLSNENPLTGLGTTEDRLPLPADAVKLPHGIHASRNSSSSLFSNHAAPSAGEHDAREHSVIVQHVPGRSNALPSDGVNTNADHANIAAKDKPHSKDTEDGSNPIVSLLHRLPPPLTGPNSILCTAESGKVPATNAQPQVRSGPEGKYVHVDKTAPAPKEATTGNEQDRHKPVRERVGDDAKRVDLAECEKPALPPLSPANRNTSQVCDTAATATESTATTATATASFGAHKVDANSQAIPTTSDAEKGQNIETSAVIVAAPAHAVEEAPGTQSDPDCMHGAKTSTSHVCPVRGIPDDVVDKPNATTAAVTSHHGTKKHSDKRKGADYKSASLSSLHSATVAATATATVSAHTNDQDGMDAKKETLASKPTLPDDKDRNNSNNTSKKTTVTPVLGHAEPPADQQHLYTPLTNFEYDYPSSYVTTAEHHRSSQSNIKDAMPKGSTTASKKNGQDTTKDSHKTDKAGLDGSHSFLLISKPHLHPRSEKADGHTQNCTAAANVAATTPTAEKTDAGAQAKSNDVVHMHHPGVKLEPASGSGTSLSRVHDDTQTQPQSQKPAVARKNMPTSRDIDTPSTDRDDKHPPHPIGSNDTNEPVRHVHPRTHASSTTPHHPSQPSSNNKDTNNSSQPSLTKPHTGTTGDAVDPATAAAVHLVPAPPPPSAQPHTSMSNTVLGATYALPVREPLTAVETVQSKTRFFPRLRSNMAKDDRSSSRLATRSLKMQLATHKCTESEVAAGLLARHKGSMTTTNIDSKSSDIRAINAAPQAALSISFNDGMQSMIEHASRSVGADSTLSSVSLNVSRSMHRRASATGASNARLALNATEPNSHSQRKGSISSLKTKTKRQTRTDLRAWQELGILSPCPRIAGNDRGGANAAEAGYAARCESASGSTIFSTSKVANNNANGTAWQRYPIEPSQAAPAEMAGEAIELNHVMHNVLPHIRHRNRLKRNDYPSKLPIKITAKQRNHRPRTPRSFYGKAGPQTGSNWFKAALDDVVSIESPDISVLERNDSTKDTGKKQEACPEKITAST